MSNTEYQVRLSLSEQELQILEELAKSNGISKGDLVRQALSDFKLFQEARKNGGSILIEDKDGNLSKVHYLWN